MDNKQAFQKNIFAVALSFSILLPIASSQNVMAKSDKKSTNTTSSAATTQDNTATTQASSTNAKVGEQQLRRMSEAIKRTKRAATDLIYECTQPVEMMGEIDIIGTDVIPIMPATAEGFGNSYIAPRPKYVNLHMQQLGMLIPILQDDINTLSVSDQDKSFTTPLISDFAKEMQELGLLYGKLQSLTTGITEYDQVQLTQTAQSVDTLLKSVDLTRKKLLHEDVKIEKQDK